MDNDRSGATASPAHTAVLFAKRSKADLPAELRLQVLTTEHWSLLSTRALSWNEAFSRATMFLSVLSGAVVALALVAQVTSFGEAFLTFALLILPVVLFVGMATFNRLNEINEEDVVWVQGMNRLRRAYLEIDPGLAEYFIAGSTEDVAGVLRTFGSRAPEGMQPAPTLRQNLSHALVTLPIMILVINCVVAAVLVGLVVAQLGASMELSAGAAILGFVIVFGSLSWYYGRQAMRFWASHRGPPESG